MAPDPTPAIVRDFNDTDANVREIGTHYDSVNFQPGLGDAGYKLQTVEHECPDCGFHCMVRRWDVRPEHPDEVRYWCLYPNCPHYLSDLFSYAFEGRKIGGRKPVVFEDAPV